MSRVDSSGETGMAENTEIDVAAAHRYFSVACFNQAWELIQKPDRGEDDNETMLELSLASLWHWSQRPDCTQVNLSIGYWQASRIYAVLGQVENARRYALLCHQVNQSGDVPLIFQGYAYEALARSEWLAGDREKMQAYLAQARGLVEQISEEEDRAQLTQDLNSIG